jgi:cytochrome c-type biogenesis protein CcmF
MDAPLVGRSLILVSLLVSVAGAMVAFTAGARSSASGWSWARRLAHAYAALLLLANAVMVHALVTHDFSVSYVAQVGARAVPDWVSVVSLWSSLEGSILFWGLVLGAYVSVATWAHRRGHDAYMPWAVGVWLATGAFFSFLLAGPAQPFHTVSPAPGDGPGPNPLLQNHVLMIIHPPFLYLGYVGMAIPFGLASAALLSGRLGHDFVRLLRTWLLLPWTFLTVAIVLGGWWAYEVLGWGGYWAWDPVENASFLPWLTATAALHSALLMERKAALKGWTITLIQASFLLTILGTFMTRSGVFNSVHSFSQSSIGPTILAFLAAALVFSIGLLATRIDRLASERALEPGMSREGAFLVNNLLFVLFTFTVLIGTVFPLLVEAARGVQMSVGRPYFDRMAIPIGATLLLLMGIGPALPWGRASREQLRQALLPPLGGAAAVLALGLGFGVRSPWTLLTLTFAGYAGQVTLAELWRPVSQRRRAAGVATGAALLDLLRRSRRRSAGYIVHAGVVLMIASIAVSSSEGVSAEVSLRAGESAELEQYTITFEGAETLQEPHRESMVARFTVASGGREIARLSPAMNQYFSQRQPIGTPDVLTRFSEDVYLSIGSIDVTRQVVGLRVMINPMVGWIWIATGIMALGGLLAVWPARPRELIRTAPARELGGAAVEGG